MLITEKWWKRFLELNYNVKIGLISTAFGSISFGMLYGNILQLFIFQVTISQGLTPDLAAATLGLAATVSGLASTISIFPSGFLADFWRRDAFIRLGGALTVLYVFMLSIAPNIEFIFIAQVLSGLAQGIQGPAREALIADSIKTGDRSRVYAMFFFMGMGLNCIGPLINVILFAILGNEWAIWILRSVILVGALFQVFSYVMIFFMRDGKTLGEESESVQFVNEDVKLNGKTTSNDNKTRLIVLGTLLISSLIIGIGAGMTVYFFSVMFKEIFFLSPITVNVIYFFTNLISGLMGFAAARVSRWIGRIQTIVTFQGTAILALLGMVVLSLIPDLIFRGSGVYIVTLPLLFYPVTLALAILFIARNGFMNASSPIHRAVVMDLVPKKHRGKFNIIEQISWGIFWSSSAGVGGFIIAFGNYYGSLLLNLVHFGYALCYMATSTIYSIATFPLIFIRRRVPKESSNSLNEVPS